MKIIKIKPTVSILSFLLLVAFASCEREGLVNTATVPIQTGLKLSEAQIQLANIRVAWVEKGAINHEILLNGVLKVDEQSVAALSSRSEGKIQRLHFKNTGAMVNKGDSLYEIYSEEMLEVAREFQGLHDNNWSSNKRSDLELAAKNKLLLLGMLESQIDRLNDTRYINPVFTIFSPEKGLIRSISVTEGEYVKAGQQLFELADDSKLWVEAQVYPNELPFLKPGMEATVLMSSVGETAVRTRIIFINPAYEPGTNVTIVRAIIDNPGKRLYPGMPALLSIKTDQQEGIIIPASAMLIDKQGYHAWVQNDDGTFVSKDLTVGTQTADSVMVLSGLEEDEKVVISGAYLLNSEKILKQSYESTTVMSMPE